MPFYPAAQVPTQQFAPQSLVAMVPHQTAMRGSMYGIGLATPSLRIALGGLVGAELGQATQMVDALSQRRLDLQRHVIEAQNGGVELPPDLVQHIMSTLDDEWNALDQSIDQTDHAGLPHWLAQAQSLGDELTHFESQLNQYYRSQTSSTASMLIGGGIVVAVVAAGAAWIIKRQSKRR